MEIAQIAGMGVLFLFMLVVGLELSLADFRRVLAAPRAVVGGTLAQILLLPLMTWGVVWALGVNPVFGAGAVLVAVSPGAGMSNILAALARANVALSVTLTALASVLAVVTLPSVASLGMRVFLEDSTAVEVPVTALVLQLTFSLLLPISLGMWFRSRDPVRAARVAPTVHRLLMAAIVLAIVVSVAFADESQLDVGGGGIAFAAAAIWTLAAGSIGWATARALRLDAEDRVTFVIEFAARNVAVASIVAVSGLGRVDLTLFSGIYAVVGYPMAATFVFLRRRFVGP